MGDLEIRNVRSLDCMSFSWTSSALRVTTDKKWMKTKVCVFSDSVFCLGKIHTSREAIAQWKGQVATFQVDNSFNELLEWMENQLNSSGKISQDSQHWKFFTEFNTIWRIYALNRNNSVIESSSCPCSMTQTSTREEIRIRVGHWAFIGPGSEVKCFRGCNYKPDGEWDSVASKMVKDFEERGHYVFKGTSALNRGIMRERKRKTPFITMENPSMWNCCIGFFTQRISSVSTEQSQIGVKRWKERNPRKEKILVMNWIGDCWKSRNPRGLSCSRCLATIKAHTPIEPVLNVHMSKLCDVYSIEVQIESKIMEGHTSWVLVCRGIERFVEELHTFDDKVYNPSTSLLKNDPEPVVLTPRIHSTGRPVLDTQDSRTDTRHSIPKSIRGIDAYRDDSGSNVHSSQEDHCTRESGTRIVHKKRDSLARTEVDQDPCNQIMWFRILVIWKTKNGDQNSKTLWPRWTRSWRSCSLGHNLAASEEGIRKKTWAQMYTRRLDSLRSARQQQNKIRILLEFSGRIGVCSSNSGALWWCNTSSGIDEPCINPIQLERIHLSQRLSITQSGLVAGGKESEGRHTVFFMLLASFGSDAHEREEPSDDFSRRIKVPYESHWRGDQNAVYLG